VGCWNSGIAGGASGGGRQTMAGFNRAAAAIADGG
jgi:hypothetical protein